MKPTMPVPSIEPALVDRRCHLLFDWIREAPGTKTKERYSLFSNPVCLDRSIADTNMFHRQCFPPPNLFITESIHAYYGSMEPKDREIFRENYSLSFFVCEKRVWTAPLVAIPFTGTLIPFDSRKLWAEALKEAPRQPNELENFPCFIPPLALFWMELHGNPQILQSGLRFCSGLNGSMDFAVR